MIPKSLLTIFLSLQSLEQPSQGSSSEYDVKIIDNLNPAINSDYGQVSLGNPDDQDVVIQAQKIYPFDSLASGDWNSALLVDGVQLTNNATSRLWSLPDAFPNLKPSHGGTKAWGPYPQGKNFTIRFDRQYNDVTRSFGWIVNGRLSAGSYKTTLRSNGKWIAGGSGSWKDDQWTTWNSGGNSCDQVDIEITEGIETGLLLLDYLAYGNK